METLEQLLSDLSDLNQQLTEELYLWTMKDKNPNFDHQNILNIGRAIHEKSLLLGYTENEIVIALPKDTPSSIHFEIPEVTIEKIDSQEIQNNIEHIPVESILEEIELEKQEPIQEIQAPKKEYASSEVIVSKEIPLADILMQKGIDNINSVIGISEKFLFIHELFKGDTEKYMAEISKLNEFNNSEQAHIYFSKLTQEKNWDVKAHAFVELKKIILRKYPVN
jgi:hypothetical protein